MNVGESIESILIGRGIQADLSSRLALFGELVLDFTRTTNVTAARDAAAFSEQILDSLTLAPDLGGTLIDIGSGGGLPGIPLAIATGYRIVLVDAVKKKVAFLARILRELSLDGEAVAGRAEKLGADAAFREKFSFATARAVAGASTVAELTVPFLAVGGRALLQRGAMDDDERRAVIDAAPMLGARVIEERLVEGNRRIVVLLKESATPSRFPRRDGIPEKRPLCVSGPASRAVLHV